MCWQNCGLAGRRHQYKRVIKGRKKAEVQTCISKRKGPNEYPEVKPGTIPRLWDCTSNKYLASSTSNSCEQNIEILACLSGLKGSKPHLRSYEVSKWALREKQGWLQCWILPSAQQPAPHCCLMWPQRANITAVDRNVPAPGSSIPSAVPSCQRLHWCLQVCLWCSGGRKLRDKGRGISYRQKKICYSKVCYGLGF